VTKASAARHSTMVTAYVPHGYGFTPQVQSAMDELKSEAQNVCCGDGSKVFPPKCFSGNVRGGAMMGGDLRHSDSANNFGGRRPDAYIVAAAASGQRELAPEETRQQLFSQARRDGGGFGGCGNKAPSLADFRLLTELGVGANSTVFRAVHISSGVEMALKCYMKSRLDAQTLQQVKDEIAIHSSLSHPDVTSLYGWFEDTSGNYYLMLELATCGDVFDRMNDWSDSHEDSAGPSESQVCSVMIRPLISAVAYLHGRGIMHRDIKAENLLMTDDNLSVKLADFGFACNHRQHKPVTRLGTLEYMVG